jgi:hypothetical protein
MRKYWLIAIVAISSVAVTFAIDSITSFVCQKPRRVTSSSAFPTMSVDFAGVSNPQLIPAEKCGLRDNDIIIGVNVFGESRAYLQLALGGLPDRHLVNDVISTIPVTITYCDRTQCTRVLSSGSVKEAVSIRCGGWLAVQEMALLVDGKKYAQSSPEIPLMDLPFEISTWKEWQQKHPDSMVYLGNSPHRENDLPNESDAEVLLN